MNTFDLIRSRRSVRSFDGTPLKSDDARKIMEYAESVKNPYSILIDWKLLDAKKLGLSSPVITGEDMYIAGKMHRKPFAEEAFGYSFEKVVLFALSLGVGTTWIAGTMNRESFERAAMVAQDEVMPCVSPLGYPAKKMSFRETMMRKGIKADSRFDFDKLFFDGDFDTPLTEEKAGALKTPLEAVRLAPSAVNKQPWRVVCTENKVHFYEKSGKNFIGKDGWDLQRIDVGIALCHFECVAKECGIETSFEVNEPNIAPPQDTRYIATYVVK
ncbi:MAG: nitroreductase [Clostridia bacterium]|nr:nitroreductase [Clostridia bacterium]